MKSEVFLKRFYKLLLVCSMFETVQKEIKIYHEYCRNGSRIFRSGTFNTTTTAVRIFSKRTELFKISLLLKFPYKLSVVGIYQSYKCPIMLSLHIFGTSSSGKKVCADCKLDKSLKPTSFE